MQSLRKRTEMAAPSDTELLTAVREAKEANRELGVARIRQQLKDENGWELSEKRVKKALAEVVAGGAPLASGEGRAACGASAATAARWTAERPSPRGYFSLTAWQPGEGTADGVVMFGGEFFDNAKNLFYNQLYRLDVVSHQWARLASSGNAPSARSAHQACVCAGHYWVFGGEFSSPTGSKFKLMDDLWKIPVSRDSSFLADRWVQVAGGGGGQGPAPRSGHRMVAVGDKLCIYGGMGEAKYYGDLHVWDTAKGAWISKVVKMERMKLGKDAPSPGPRAGFAMWPDGDTGLYIWGGTRDGSRGGSEYLADFWRLDTSTWAWTRVLPKVGSGPSVRSGAAVVLVGCNRRVALLVGGVADRDCDDGGAAAAKAKAKPLQVFLSDVHCFDMDACAWSVPGRISAAPDGLGVDAATAAGGGTAVSERAPAGRRNAQAVYVDESSSLVLVCDFCM